MKIPAAFLLTIFSTASNANDLDIMSIGAKAAVDECRKDGFNVAVSIVDLSGNQLVFLKDDASTVHTKDTAYRKAYTVVTLGPIFKLNTSSEISKVIVGKPVESSFVEIPNIALMPGAVSINKGGKIIGSIGVGGAPGGDKDEKCATAGAKLINGMLEKKDNE